MISGPPLPAIGSIGIEIFGPDSGSARWDAAQWGDAGTPWNGNDWRDVTPQSVTAEINWGADYAEGVLSSPATGQWSIRTYDPKRVLDPSNGSSPYVSVLRPGNPVRVVFREGVNTHVVRTGLMDEVHYDFASKVGSLRGTDLLQLLSRARLPANQTGVPNTLRARAAFLVNKVNLATKIPVAVTPPNVERVTNGSFEDGLTGWDGAPVGGSVITDAAPSGSKVWQQLGNGSSSWPSISQYIANIVPGSTYAVSAYVKSVGTNAPAMIRVDAYKDGAWVADAVLQLQRAGASEGDFTKLSGNYSVPANGSVNAIVVLVYLNQSPTTAGQDVRFDGISVIGPDTFVLPDPAVGAIDTSEMSVLDHIAMAARDAQYAFWLDRDGVMQFRSFGDPIDNGVQLGGADGIAMETVASDASLAGIYTSCTVYDTTAPTTAIKKTDSAASLIFGEIALLRERPVPSASAWADNLIADRSGASLQYMPGILRPQTVAQLLSILNLEMVEIVTITVESATPTLNVPARALGVKLTADTAAGWAAEILSYVPAKEWNAGDVPVLPDPPDPPATQTVTRTYVANKDCRAARTSANQNYGSGTEAELPVGAWSGWRNRAFIDFPSIPWGDVKSIVKAELILRTSTQVNVGFGSNPKVVCKRVTQSWSEGNASSPSSGNATVYPGPSVTSTGSVTKTVTDNENTNVTIDVTAIVKAWAPTAIGGSAQTQRGIGIFSAGEDSTQYTTEFKSRETSNDPELKLTVKIPT